MITLQRLVSELKADSLNEIIAGGGYTPKPCKGSSSSSSSSSRKKKKKKVAKKKKYC